MFNQFDAQCRAEVQRERPISADNFFLCTSRIFLEEKNRRKKKLQQLNIYLLLKVETAKVTEQRSQHSARLNPVACQRLPPCKCFIHINKSNQGSNQIRENLNLTLNTRAIVILIFGGGLCNVAPSSQAKTEDRNSFPFQSTNSKDIKA